VIFVISHHAYRQLYWYHGGRMFVWLDKFDISALGVTCFLIMSGLGLFLNNPNGSTVSFIFNRIKKLMSYFWTSYATVALFLFWTTARPFLQSGSFGSILATFFGIDGWTMGWLIPQSRNYLIGEWYFGCLIGLYLMYSVIAKIIYNRPRVGWFLLGISVPLSIGLEHATPWLHVHTYIWNSNPYCNPLVLLPLFLFGMCFARTITNQRALQNYAIGAVALYILSLTTGFLNFSQITNKIQYVCLFIIVCAVYKNGLNAFNGIIGWIAKYSFVAFLVHHQIIIFWLEHHQDVVPSLHNSHNFICYMLSIILLSFFAAYLIYPFGKRLQAFMSEKSQKGKPKQ
jgi:hypothetical protein